MYKTFALLICIAIGTAAGTSNKLIGRSSQIQHAVVPFQRSNNGIDWCPQCLNTFDELIQIVLDIVLNVGILNSCGELCTIVADKTGSQILGFACTIGCDVLGLDEFIKLIQKADIDPIYYCEQVKLCPINDNGDATFKSFNIVPPRAAVGTKIAINFAFVSKNGTGTGQVVLHVDTVDKLPLDGGFLLEAQKPGTYNDRLTINASPDPECDPEQDQCEAWLPGRYNVTVFICNGQCGSHHPHSQTYDIARGFFDLHE